MNTAKDFWSKLVRFLIAREGPTAVEYAALILVIVLGCLTAITIYGQATAENPELPHQAVRQSL
ncbi:MAG: Flp family type IVb pilin [Pirellulales bacterium]|nr:Flp family type IVb pilin [Pirellulales bacterium]